MPFICALRAGLLVVLALYGFTTNTYIWHSTGVNSTLIFEFDSHDYRSFTQLYEVWNIILSLLATIFSYVEVIIIVWFSWTCLQIASLMGVIWIICVYLFVFTTFLLAFSTLADENFGQWLRVYLYILAMVVVAMHWSHDPTARYMVLSLFMIFSYFLNDLWFQA